ncbi:hypothetical protein I6F35_02585 [Bradyrhizobium sp. BRP22]|uniref:hypothetical protein n=1 Tax=Bradyrhizobium sp. BRP22 TaxID=2793821 RepID=UPI001CD23211|nr:hypothetical protein [Bradyrhizobium sp. BRP22]MCA1452100.1 hypothetical protein [Bradyrhizobium sp. BRP22]
MATALTRKKTSVTKKEEERDAALNHLLLQVLRFYGELSIDFDPLIIAEYFPEGLGRPERGEGGEGRKASVAEYGLLLTLFSWLGRPFTQAQLKEAQQYVPTNLDKVLRRMAGRGFLDKKGPNYFFQPRSTHNYERAAKEIMRARAVLQQLDVAMVAYLQAEEERNKPGDTDNGDRRKK